ncbi:MAG: hypothetical protein LH603_11975 [Pseudonocardia sp.]|nr:hypothetical protein [Pseudonocardia sp.]
MPTVRAVAAVASVHPIGFAGFRVAVVVVDLVMTAVLVGSLSSTVRALFRDSMVIDRMLSCRVISVRRIRRRHGRVVVSGCALVIRVGQQSSTGVQGRVHVVGSPDIDASSGRRHHGPDMIEDGTEIVAGDAGDHQQIGVGRAGRERPTAPRQLSLHPHPHGGATDGRNEQDMRPAGPDAQQDPGQVHRSAPSRQA